MKIIRLSDKGITYEAPPFLAIRHRRADFEGFAKDYYVVEFKRRGGIVAVREDRILMVRQYRLLTDDLSCELPGGTIEDSEDAEVGLARECEEETGILPKSLKPLLVYYPGLDNVDNRTAIYWTDDLSESRPFVANPREVCEIAWLPLEECLGMVYQGRILDAMSVTGLLGYALRQRVTRR